MPRSLSQPQKGSVMSSRTILSLAGVAILGLACVSTDAFARGRAGGFHAGGVRAAGFHGGGVRAANFSRGVAWRGGAVRGGAYRGAALRGGAYRAAAWRGGVYRGDYWRPGWGRAARRWSGRCRRGGRRRSHSTLLLWLWLSDVWILSQSPVLLIA